MQSGRVLKMAQSFKTCSACHISLQLRILAEFLGGLLIFVESFFKANAVLISSFEYVLELIVIDELFDVKDNGAFTATPFKA